MKHNNLHADNTVILNEHEWDVVLDSMFFKYKRLAEMLKNDNKLLNTPFGQNCAKEAVEIEKIRKKIIEERAKHAKEEA